MELTTFVENFAAQYDDVPATSFKPDTRFREVGEWDSLIALSVIAMVDEEYGVKLTGDEIRNSNTVEDIYKIVSAKL